MLKLNLFLGSCKFLVLIKLRIQGIDSVARISSKSSSFTLDYDLLTTKVFGIALATTVLLIDTLVGKCLKTPVLGK